MQRHVSSRLSLSVSGSSHMALMVAVASGHAVTETLEIAIGGRPVTPREIDDVHGSRLHVFDASDAEVTVSYEATVAGRADPLGTTEADLLTYLRPSRYSEADTLGAMAQEEFGGLEDVDLLNAVSSWVGSKLSYVPGSSGPTDGALTTLVSRNGVCRDYAHLVIAFLRARDVPARLVSAYAPGLSPMDFHAVVEAHVGGAWHVVDATTLAPRQSLVRIATGRDAADTAFLSSYGGSVTLQDIVVSAVADTLPSDDVRELVTLR